MSGWADGIHLNVRPEKAIACLLVLVDVWAVGGEELVALEDGYRKSGQSCAGPLRDCARLRMRTGPGSVTGLLFLEGLG
ncbi:MULTISPECIES: hypothetical protein [Streptomyces]|uniref:Uncharacterized protein n=1 Tax=Streptomyces doudnae TaxID=3075536 RepID=A0ABD5EWW8_9ACTN|nr:MULTISPECIES: hypothetical protein [unclassified Streptomyces]MDT0439241.1 hypothetical protein [Streptomyces sp. DSM 41981]MYQ65856.1 hypothetical protein [Streptomyces sp. SID4950]